MKRFLFLPLLALSLALIVNAQTPAPTSTPKPAEPDDDVVKISTTLIQVDVTVTGKDGRIVSDLQPEDFEIYENGKKQNITNFSLIYGNSVRAADASGGSGRTIGAPAAPAQIKPEQVRRTMALVIDDLGLTFNSLVYVRRALKKYIDEQMQPGDLVAIIRTGGGAGVSQQFTSDKKRLQAALETIRWNVRSRGGLDSMMPLPPSLLNEASGAQATDEQMRQARNQQRTEEFNNLREEILTDPSLEAVAYIIDGMKELPGRKSIVFFSDGFSIYPKSDNIPRVGALGRLTALANRAAVTIYTQQAIEMNPVTVTAADNVNTLSVRQLQESYNYRPSQDFRLRDGLSYLAKETGGRAFFGDQFNENLSRALTEQNVYYLIGYQPDDETFDPNKRQFNNLEVKVKRKDSDVRYRSGFFAAPDSRIVPKTLTPVQQIAKALTSPFSANDINLQLNTIFGNDEKTGQFLQSFLYIKADNLKFSSEADGKYKVSFDVLAALFGATGEAADQLGQTYTITVGGERYEKILKEGLVYNFIFPVKKAGAYQMRVALRDNQTAKFGSAAQFVELPDLKKNLLASSGIILENLTSEQWKNLQTGVSNSETSANKTGNSYTDTSLRRFKKGTYLRYGLEIYNSKSGTNQKPDLQTQIKIFREDKQILEGKITPLNVEGQTNWKKIKFAGTVNIGKEMPAGEYVLQITVKDNLAKEKSNLTTQAVQFEIIN